MPSRKWTVLHARTGIAVLLILSITSMVLYFFSSEIQQIPITPEPAICFRPACICGAAILTKSLNRNANPCDDFYEFACGNWNKSDLSMYRHAKLDSWGVSDMQNRAVKEKLKMSLTAFMTKMNDSVSSVTSYAMKKMSLYYNLCLTATYSRQTASTTGFLEYLWDQLGMREWPRTESAGIEPGDWFRVLCKGRMIGRTFGILINTVETHPEDPRQNIITFGAPKLTLDAKDYTSLNQTAADNYRLYARKAIALYKEKMRESFNHTAVDEFFAKVLDFELNLMNYVAEKPPLNHVMSLQEFAGNYTPGVGGEDWVLYFNEAFGISGSSAAVTPETMVSVHQPDYYSTLAHTLRNLAGVSAGEPFLYNYAGWKALESLLSHLDSSFRALPDILRDSSHDVPRSTHCVEQIIKQFPNAMGSIFVRDHFYPLAKAELGNMVGLLLNGFSKLIQQTDWMDAKTRAEALKKASRITPLVAYDDYLLRNYSRLDAEHESFQPYSTYLDMYISASMFVVHEEGKRLIRKNNPTEWSIRPLTVNAEYFSVMNSIQFPAAYFSPTVYDPGYPHYWKFGGAGDVIGHEIAHAFDRSDLAIDADGQERNWMSLAAQEEFNQRVARLAEQYSGYNYLGIQLNGTRSRDEDIADNVGLTLSVGAYREYVAAELGSKPEPRLPGFQDYTSEQMLFLTRAQSYCGNYRASDVGKDAHNPPRVRLIGPLQNSEAFALAYQCPLGSYMNPVRKHKIW